MSLLRHNLCEVTLDPLLMLSFELSQVRSTASSSVIYGDRVIDSLGAYVQAQDVQRPPLGQVCFHVRVSM